MEGANRPVDDCSAPTGTEWRNEHVHYRRKTGRQIRTGQSARKVHADLQKLRSPSESCERDSCGHEDKRMLKIEEIKKIDKISITTLKEELQSRKRLECLGVNLSLMNRQKSSIASRIGS